MFSLESPHLGDSNEYTRYTIFNKLKKIILNYPKSAPIGFFPGTQERGRNSRGKQAISVQACIKVTGHIFKRICSIGARSFFYELTPS